MSDTEADILKQRRLVWYCHRMINKNMVFSPVCLGKNVLSVEQITFFEAELFSTSVCNTSIAVVIVISHVAPKGQCHLSWLLTCLSA